MVAVAFSKTSPAKAFQAPGDWLTVVLPESADACYELFCDVSRVPEWLPVVSTAVITQGDAAGRAKKVAFQASLQRATVGYTCLYRYRPEEWMISWATPARASIVVRGMAQFQPIAGGCLMTYALELKIGRGLPAFADATYATHASSAALAQFAAFARRTV
jgi:hypothetical protein